MMQIAYKTTFDSSNINSWSGIGYHIGKPLENAGFLVQTIGNLKSKVTLTHLIKRFVYPSMVRKNYLRSRKPDVQKHYSDQVQKALTKMDPDVILCAGTSPIAYLKTNIPIVIWVDSTFDRLMNFYPEYSNLCAETIKKGRLTTQIALNNCRLAIFSSDWAANGVVKNYEIAHEKVKVVPFGANIPENRAVEDISVILTRKNNETCNLLFVGKDWHRKRGDFAVKVSQILNDRGVKTELHIAGCSIKNDLPNFVIQHGLISKENDDGILKLEELYRAAHFLILPTTAETYGIVLAEASSFGLPALTTKVGGIPTVIVDGKNGQTFDVNDSPDHYCDYIEQFFSSLQQYEKLAF